jgi:hypothetical protein
MSRCEIQQVTCPVCKTVQEEKVFVSVNGARIKSAADRIIDGSWGELSCLACGARYARDTPLLYTDIPGGVWIVQHANCQRGRYPALETEAAAIFEREFIERPPLAIRAQAMAAERRICFGRAQLAEKLLARRHGINDRALECLKLVLARDYLGELFHHGPTEFYLQQADQEKLGLLAVTIADSRPVHALTVARGALQTLVDDLKSFYTPFPELFSNLYVNASRYVTEPGVAQAEQVG